MNVAPGYTLDAVEAIVTHPRVSIRGLLLTLKLSAPDAAEHVPEYLERVRSWGYNLVRARQLQYNRREVCVAALQSPFVGSRPFRNAGSFSPMMRHVSGRCHGFMRGQIRDYGVAADASLESAPLPG